MRILVVCAAGASSTFVAQRLRRAAAEAGLDHDVTAITQSVLPDRLGEAHLVLIGPHLVDEAEAIRADAARRGVHVLSLPADVFDDRDGARTLHLVSDAIPSPSGRPA